MITTYLQLPKYNWRLTLFYNIRPKDLSTVLTDLWELGCANSSIKTVAITLLDHNTGFTYTVGNYSIMGIGISDSKAESINTLVHEIKHLQSDICNYYSISHSDELAAIIAGDIAMEIYYNLNPKILWQEVKMPLL